MTPAQPSLARNTLRGIAVSYGSAVITGAMQIATTAVVARMVAPRDFGILAMAQLGVRFAGYFSQFGVGSALVQKRDLSESDTAAAHLMAIAAGVLFTAAGLLLAPLGGAVFHSNDVVWVIRALAFTFLLTSFTVAPLSLLRRNLRFDAISAIDIASYVLGYAAPCLTLVWLGHGLWGLVAGNLGAVLVQWILLQSVQPVAWKWVREWEIYRGLLSYGSRISITGFLEYITSNIDTFVVGRYLGPKPLGLYTRAYNLAAVPMHMMSSAAARVLFPVFSRVQHDSVKLARTYKDTLTLLFVLTCPLGFALVPSAPHIVRLLLGPAWAEAALLLAVFGILAPFDMAVALPGIVLDATGTLNKKLYVRLATLMAAGTVIYLHRESGIVTIAWLMLGSCVLTFFGYHFLVVRQLGMSWSSALSPVLFGACTGAIPLVTIHFAIAFANLELLPALALEGSILILSYVLILVFSPFPMVNAALSRVLTALLGETRQVPENLRSRCLALQLLATARAEGGC